MRDQELLRMNEAMLGVRLRPESNPQVVWDTVAAGGEDVLVTLHWFNGQTDYHVLNLLRIENDRMHFHNPVMEQQAAEPGSLLEDDAPARIFHQSGDESVTHEEFESWFEHRDALGYLPEE